MSKYLQLLIVAICMLLLSLNSPAQSRWSLVGMTPDSAVWFVDKAVKKKPSKVIQAWEKVIYQDGTYSVALNEWKCSEKMKRLIQVNNYDPTGDYLSRSLTPLPWRYIVPDSIEEKTFQIVCKDSIKEETSENNSKADASKSIAQITSKKAKLMGDASARSAIIRELAFGEKLFLVSEKSVGVWYQVIDPKTNSQGWLNGNHFKIVRAKNSNSTLGKTKNKQTTKRIKKN